MDYDVKIFEKNTWKVSTKFFYFEKKVLCFWSGNSKKHQNHTLKPNFLFRRKVHEKRQIWRKIYLKMVQKFVKTPKWHLGIHSEIPTQKGTKNVKLGPKDIMKRNSWQNSNPNLMFRNWRKVDVFRNQNPEGKCPKVLRLWGIPSF